VNPTHPRGQGAFVTPQLFKNKFLLTMNMTHPQVVPKCGFNANCQCPPSQKKKKSHEQVSVKFKTL
jgi:hypothetical protein